VRRNSLLIGGHSKKQNEGFQGLLITYGVGGESGSSSAGPSQGYNGPLSSVNRSKRRVRSERVRLGGNVLDNTSLGERGTRCVVQRSNGLKRTRQRLLSDKSGRRKNERAVSPDV